MAVSAAHAMTKDQVLEEFTACGALMNGHFILSSGLRSDTYLNKSIVSMYPDRTARLCAALALKAQDKFGEQIDYVISPAMGGIIYGYETARALELPFMYTERVNGQFELRRGFQIEGAGRVLIVEDIISTGLSARECVEAVKRHGGTPLAVACLIDRSGGKANVGLPILPLAELDVPAYRSDQLPAHLKDIPPVKPGSRGLA
uniref:Orotate phosphoribosyltransferase n=2 Tax=Aquisalinus luteolus TaxID=1566827 RepID=A0A8J3A1L8_9PROT|nr:orotate phosphoribosyltransferase [Aquisalinus luteolus]GGH95802.1 orotate phosphoribosyltransferase [Aquisalinus luteolus]